MITHARVKKGGNHQRRKWVVLPNNSNTPCFHSKDWAETMAVAVPLTHHNRIENPAAYKACNSATR
jgi:hypothetical protein